MKYDKETFREVLEPHHRTYWKIAYKKLQRKMQSLKSSLKKRSEDSQVLFIIEMDEIREMFYNNYGDGCKYCNRKMTLKNMVCDHIIPLAKDGDSVIDNLQLICKSCNTRKGPLDEDEFKYLMQWVEHLKDETKEYVLRKLAKGGRY
jgi:5-methylcytosine-specific restriction endonuclease McrA